MNGYINRLRSAQISSGRTGQRVASNAIASKPAVSRSTLRIGAGRAVERAGELRTDLQIRTFTPAPLGQLGHRAHDRLGRAPRAGIVGFRLREQLEPPGAYDRHVTLEDREHEIVAAAEVVLHGRRIALARLPHDLRERYRLDAALREEPRRRVDQLVPSRDRGLGVRHATVTVPTAAHPTRRTRP